MNGFSIAGGEMAILGHHNWYQLQCICRLGTGLVIPECAGTMQQLSSAAHDQSAVWKRQDSNASSEQNALFCAAFNLKLRAVHLTGHLNGRADTVSHHKLQTFFKEVLSAHCIPILFPICLRRYFSQVSRKMGSVPFGESCSAQLQEQHGSKL